MRFKALALLITATLLFPVAVFGYTDPGTPTGFINDFADVISPQFEQRMELISRELNQKTGAQLVVVTMQSIGDYELLLHYHPCCFSLFASSRNSGGDSWKRLNEL